MRSRSHERGPRTTCQQRSAAACEVLFEQSIANEAILILTALVAVYIVLGMLMRATSTRRLSPPSPRPVSPQGRASALAQRRAEEAAQARG
jgi:hypothetical protein